MSNHLYRTLNRENATRYLESKHAPTPIHVLDVQEYLEDATPVIRVNFTHEGYTETADVWLERTRDGFECLYGEW